MSIEQRKTIGQTYSTLRGFFRQYELIYLVANERDVVRLRTNFRKGEDVRLYHTLTKPEDARSLFLQYLQWIEDLRLHPHWYNALTDNCTSSVTSYLTRNHVGGLSRWDWRLLLNGLGDQMLYDYGDLATEKGFSFKALGEQAFINDEAKSLGDDPNFSRDIRLGHPGFLRLRPTSEPYILPSDTGIQSLIHSSSRLRSMLAPTHFTRRTCETARRSMGLQFAIHFRARHTHPQCPDAFR